MIPCMYTHVTQERERYSREKGVSSHRREIFDDNNTATHHTRKHTHTRDDDVDVSKWANWFCGLPQEEEEDGALSEALVRKKREILSPNADVNVDQGRERL